MKNLLLLFVLSILFFSCEKELPNYYHKYSVQLLAVSCLDTFFYKGSGSVGDKYLMNLSNGISIMQGAKYGGDELYLDAYSVDYDSGWIAVMTVIGQDTFQKDTTFHDTLEFTQVHYRYTLP
jgi:hypothetical protein